MKPPPMGYVGPTSLSEVLSVLDELNENCKILAGGQSLVPLLNMRLAGPEWLVDIGRVEELRAWQITDEALRIGAGVTLAEVECRFGDGCPVLQSALSQIGHRTIRNRGTICGSLAHADPAAEIPAVAVAVGAVLRLVSARRVRDVAAEEFFLSPLTTVLEPDEVLTEVAFPIWPGASGALVEVTRRHGDFAIAGAAVALSWSSGVIVRAGVALAGVAPHPIRVPAEMLVGSTGSDDVLAATAALARAAAQPTGDYHASAEYRRAMAGETVLMALEQAVAERPISEDQ